MSNNSGISIPINVPAPTEEELKQLKQTLLQLSDNTVDILSKCIFHHRLMEVLFEIRHKGKVQKNIIWQFHDGMKRYMRGVFMKGSQN